MLRYGITVEQTLRQVTAQLTARMAHDGWWLNHVLTHEPPTPWDINNGWCEEWAELAVAQLGEGDVHWLDDDDTADIYANHAVLVLDGRYYDAQAPDGVDDLKDLPLVRGVPRSAYL